MAAQVTHSLCRLCCQNLVWVLKGGKPQVDDIIEESRQVLLSHDSSSNDALGTRQESPSDQLCRRTSEEYDPFEAPPMVLSSPYSLYRRTSGDTYDPFEYAQMMATQPTDVVGSDARSAIVSTLSELDGGAQTAVGDPIDRLSTVRREDIELPRADAGNSGDSRSRKDEVELPRSDAASNAGGSRMNRDDFELPRSDVRRLPDAFFNSAIALPKDDVDAPKATMVKTFADGTGIIRHSLAQAAEKVWETDLAENAAGAAGAAASVAGSAAVVAANVAGSAAVTAGGALRSSIVHAASLSRKNSLQSTGSVAQQRLVEAKTACEAHVPKAAAVAAKAAGKAKDKFAKASVGFAGMFKRSQAAPACRFCSAAMQWSDYAEGVYTMGWTCENINVCGASAASDGPWRWFCVMCQNHDLCVNCSPQDARKVDSPPKQIFPRL